MTTPLVDEAWQPSTLELSRRALRRRATTRSVLLALLSSLAVAAVLVIVVANTPGWKVVRETFFDPKVALASVGPIFQG